MLVFWQEQIGPWAPKEKQGTALLSACNAGCERLMIKPKGCFIASRFVLFSACKGCIASQVELQYGIFGLGQKPVTPRRKRKKKRQEKKRKFYAFQRS